MKTQTIGKSGLVSTRIAYGCWRLVGTWNPKEVTPQRMEAGRKAVVAAFEAGYTLFDNADIYCHGVCETVFGEALKQVSGVREKILVASKCGIRPPGDPKPDAPYRYDFSAGYITQCCEQSLKRMGVQTIDLYMLHRPDLLMNPEEVAGAFEQLKKQGKVREFGVSNFTPSQVTALQRACPMPLVTNQVQIHLGDLRCFNDGTIDQCLAEKMTLLAWSPLGGGTLSGKNIDPSNPRRDQLVKLMIAMDKIAHAHGATRTAVALAWLLKHPAGIIPIIGSANPQHIMEATKADSIELSREDWYRLLELARGERLP